MDDRSIETYWEGLKSIISQHPWGRALLGARQLEPDPSAIEPLTAAPDQPVEQPTEEPGDEVVETEEEPEFTPRHSVPAEGSGLSRETTSAMKRAGYGRRTSSGREYGEKRDNQPFILDDWN